MVGACPCLEGGVSVTRIKSLSPIMEEALPSSMHRLRVRLIGPDQTRSNICIPVSSCTRVQLLVNISVGDICIHL